MTNPRAPWVPRPPEKSYLLKRHGITQEEWRRLFEHQARMCAICGRSDRKLYVDHHHDMGKAGLVRGSVRGLLCWICNTGIQAFRENVQAMHNAAIYVVQPPAWKLWPDEKRDTE
jgi:hypothetical protein